MNEKKRLSCIRRLDDQGRLVIPGEIRRMLRYREGDCLEISTEGKDITISHCQPLSYMDSLCAQCLTAFGKNSSAACIICSSENVVAARGISISQDILLPEPVRERIRERSAYEYPGLAPLDLLGDGKHPIDALYPVGNAGKAAYGAVLLLHYRPVTDRERACARMMADILTELLP